MHTKIQGNRPFGCREEDFLRFKPYMGMAAILVMWPGPFEQTFIPLSHRSSLWNLTLIGPVNSEEKMFKECGRRTTEAYLSYKFTKWAFGACELKSVTHTHTRTSRKQYAPTNLFSSGNKKISHLLLHVLGDFRRLKHHLLQDCPFCNLVVRSHS